ncbi:hypothetical protein [Tenacibaculum finnmarkense]|uniref:hypothetical protein n=1 Tax=Tenacibaculum finnmarkense TaxID=2781243 RepID=UPI001EFBA99F|nr:hypothetical protein [Tenacibaculum finnmarkense]MCG8185205.1 hypothetical protein [Tenacibaculum finnmarkense genomovar finnmarkense]MCG8792225.1 hypothetical protein [Tenacibaculum finnmarkense]MCM8861770.1 hypothetical protein [Tenacibaculum finnmarkense genomovar finnmarkense]
MKTKIFNSVSEIGRTPTEVIQTISDLTNKGVNVFIASSIENSKSNYKGRQKGTKTPSSEFLKKNKTIANAISKNPSISLRKIAIKTGVSHSKVAKVKKMLISEKKYQFDLLESIKDIESKE